MLEKFELSVTMVFGLLLRNAVKFIFNWGFSVLPFSLSPLLKKKCLLVVKNSKQLFKNDLLNPEKAEINQAIWSLFSLVSFFFAVCFSFLAWNYHFLHSWDSCFSINALWANATPTFLFREILTEKSILFSTTWKEKKTALLHLHSWSINR